METTLNIPIPIVYNPANGFAYAERWDGSAYAPSVQKAKSKLRPLIEDQINEALLTVNNYQRRFIGTGAGEILIVSYRHGSWCYDIVGPGRAHSCSCCGFADFDQAVSAARSHALQSYQDVAWECY